MQLLKPLPFNKAAELSEMITSVIKHNKMFIYHYFEQSLNRDYENKLDSYVRITEVNGICVPIILEKDLPAWLNSFLLDCYEFAHNRLVSEQS